MPNLPTTAASPFRSKEAVIAAISQEAIDVLAVLNALRAAATPSVLMDYQGAAQK